MKNVFTATLLLGSVLLFSCNKKPEEPKDFIPDTSGNQYLYYYIDDELYEADFNYYDTSWKGGGGHRSYFGVSRISDNDTIAGLEEWEHPYQTIKFNIGLVYRPELKNGGGLEMQLKDVYNHTEFEMVQGYCQPRPYPIQYAELDTNFAVYSASINNNTYYFCSSNAYSGWVRLTTLINTAELVHIEGEFELTLHYNRTVYQSSNTSPPESLTLTGGRFYKKVYKTH